MARTHMLADWRENTLREIDREGVDEASYIQGLLDGLQMRREDQRISVFSKEPFREVYRHKPEEPAAEAIAEEPAEERPAEELSSGGDGEDEAAGEMCDAGAPAPKSGRKK